jgi:outer membrane protein TolC
MNYVIRTVVALSIAFQSVFAAEAGGDCQPISYTDFVKCAEKISSDIRISEQQVQAVVNLEDAAQQWVNPDLEVDSVWKGSEKAETTAALLFTVRLGGKKNALVSEAKGEIQRSQANRDLSVNGTRLEIMLSLYRLSHLKAEIALEEESVVTFTKIVGQFQKRPALSPEQDVSLTVFKMSLADHQLRLTRLQADQEKLVQALFSVTGIGKAAILKSLPSRKDKWPEISIEGDVESSPQMRQAVADLKVARSQKDKADSDAWPDLKIGPSMKLTKENGENNTFVGVGLSMSLPMFTTNSGNRAYRSQKVIEVELVANQSRKKLTSARSELVNRYSKTVGSLKNSLSLKDLEEKHEQVERQFFKGLVSSSLIIEAHRQLFELEERRNASELEALESYGRILIMDNKFNEVIL